MRIVILPTGDLAYNSGSVIYIKNLFKFLIQRGHQIYMIAKCMPKDIPEEYQGNIVVVESMIFHPIVDDRKIEKTQYYNMILDVLTTIKDLYLQFGKIDLIYAQYASINGFIASIVKNILDIPICLSVFGRDVNIGYNIDKLNRYMIFESIKNATCITVVNDYLKKKIDEIYEGTEQYVIPMPVDNEVMLCNDRFKFSQKDNTINIAVVASCFTTEKGIEIVLSAISYLIEKYNFHVYIAGQDDDDDLRNYRRIISFVEEKKMENNVTFLGYLSRRSVGKLLYSVDFLVGARMVGNFSSVILEALFCECMIFTSDISAHASLLERNTEFLFKNGDPLSLVKKIETYIEDKDYQNRCKRIIKNWKNKYWDYYSEDSCFNKVFEVFERCVKKENENRTS